MTKDVNPCSRCGRRWEDHYRPELLKFKSGPYGTFGLKNGDHLPHIVGVHAQRGEDGLCLSGAV